MKKLFLVFCLFLIRTQGVAADVSTAFASYVEELFDSEDFRSLWKTFDLPRDDPDGGYLFYFVLSFAPKEDGFLFIASDRFGEERRSAPAWSVYANSSEGWGKIGSGLMLSTLGFKVDEPSRTIVEELANESFHTIQFGRNALGEQKFFMGPDTDDSTRARLKEMGSRYVPEVYKMPLSAFLRRGDLPWRPLRRENAAIAQSLDPEDGWLLEIGENMSWSEAKMLAGSLRKRVSRVEGGSDQPPALTVPTGAEQGKGEPQIRTDVEGSKFSPGARMLPSATDSPSHKSHIWLLMTGMAVVMIVAFAFLRRRSG